MIRCLPSRPVAVVLLFALALSACQTSVSSLLAEQRFQEAYDRLVLAEKENPMDWQVKRQLAYALGGWFEFSEAGRPTVVAGLGRPVEAYRKYYGAPVHSMRATRPVIEKFSLEWYRYMWECYWFSKRASRADPKYENIAPKFFRLARSTDDFAHLRAFGDAGEELYRYSQANR